MQEQRRTFFSGTCHNGMHCICYAIRTTSADEDQHYATQRDESFPNIKKIIELNGKPGGEVGV